MAALTLVLLVILVWTLWHFVSAWLLIGIGIVALVFLIFLALINDGVK